jgi:hypothetical protein
MLELNKKVRGKMVTNFVLFLSFLTIGGCEHNNMNHIGPFRFFFWTTLFSKYSTKSFLKNHDNFLNNILVNLALKICLNTSFLKN